MTKHEDLPCIQHILNAIKDVEESLKNITKEQFIKNKDVKEANIRRIEIIGEAVKNISQSLKDKHKEIEWIKIAGTRDKMIHHYFGINLDIIWEILKKDIPDLEEKLIRIRKEF